MFDFWRCPFIFSNLKWSFFAVSLFFRFCPVAEKVQEVHSATPSASACAINHRAELHSVSSIVLLSLWFWTFSKDAHIYMDVYWEGAQKKLGPKRPILRMCVGFFGPDASKIFRYIFFWLKRLLNMVFYIKINEIVLEMFSMNKNLKIFDLNEATIFRS